MEGIKKYRISLAVVFLLTLLAACAVYYSVCRQSIPDTIRLAIDAPSEFDYKIPAIGVISDEKQEIDTVDLKKKFQLKSEQSGNYKMETKLFGFVKLKEVTIEALERQTAAPSGKLTGIYIETDGLFVIDTAEVTTKDGEKMPAKNKLKSGDYITKIDGENINSKMEFLEKINESKGKTIVLTVIRSDSTKKVRIKPVIDEEDGQYKIGAYIRNNTQGIGTITYTQGQKFAALGHGISDIDLGSLLSIRGGEIYQAEITNIKKGSAGSPGEIVGMIDYREENLKGSIVKNTKNGIFGVFFQEQQEEDQIPVALKQEVKEGAAQIISYVSGEREEYDIQITSVDKGNNEKLKGMTIKVTDEKLKKLTNGIVQGMSGSPIIQDGKLVGAVTHVFVSDPTKGYGIFIENMLDEAE
ncbi:MAG TPA: SpoIVB peptidase [Candidatus Fimousia stercorigallinarum]|nr:SpoIVB peptidase [Candidatus Fimousia stercorigallinarum]